MGGDNRTVGGPGVSTRLTAEGQGWEVGIMSLGGRGKEGGVTICRDVFYLLRVDTKRTLRKAMFVFICVQSLFCETRA